MRTEGIIESIRYRGYKINIGYETDVESPRTWDNLGKMICFHRKYNLGDKHDLCSSDFEDWEDMEHYLRKTYKPGVLHPLYLYDHSGITISTAPFGCRWDSGQVGFVFATRADILAAYGTKRLSKKLIAHADKCILNEVKEYDSYLTGEVYRYEVISPIGREIDQCCGYYGDIDKSGIVADAKAAVDADIKWRKEHPYCRLGKLSKAYKSKIVAPAQKA